MKNVGNMFDHVFISYEANTKMMMMIMKNSTTEKMAGKNFRYQTIDL